MVLRRSSHPGGNFMQFFQNEITCWRSCSTLAAEHDCALIVWALIFCSQRTLSSPVPLRKGKEHFCGQPLWGTCHHGEVPVVIILCKPPEIHVSSGKKLTLKLTPTNDIKERRMTYLIFLSTHQGENGLQPCSLIFNKNFINFLK